jgi:hypothetical protein
VVGSSPESEHSGSLDRIGVTFDESIDASTFTVADVINLSGPSGAIVPTGVNQLTGSDFEIVFDSQSTLGDYTLTLGPDIEDLFGNQMDQDGDGAVGETPEDQYSTTIALTPAPFEKHLDFGKNRSPVAAGYEGVVSNSNYSSAVGHGWLSGTVGSRDRGVSAGDALSRDFNFTKFATFVVDVPAAGFYDVTLTMGDGRASTPLRDEMGVFLEGLQVDSVASQPGEYVTTVYQVAVSDGQLTLLLDDLGGSDLYVIINGMSVTSAEAAAAAIAPSLATKTRKSASLVAVQLASDAQPLRTMHSVGESTSQSGRRGLPRYAKPLLAIEQFFTTLANSAVQSSRTRGMGAADVRISAGDSYARALDVVLVDFEKSILVDLL